MASTVYDASFNGTALKQVLRSDVTTNITRAVGRYSGGVDPQMQSVAAAEPRIMLQSGDVAGAIGLLTDVMSGGYYASDVLIPWNKRTLGGTFTTTAGTVLTCKAGLLVLESISAQQDSEEGATASLEFYPVWNQTDDLVVATYGQTLSSQDFNMLYGLGQLKMNGTFVGGLVGLDFKPGITCEVKRYHGLPYAQTVYIKERNPSVELTFEDADSLANFGAMFTVVSTVLCYFRKRAAGGTYVADGTAEHIGITLTGGLSTSDSMSGSGQENAENKVTLWANTVAASTAAAIA